MPQPDGRFKDVAERALEWARQRDYAGFNKHDGLNSPLLAAVSNNHKWLRIFAIQGVMRSPVNLRPMLRVPPVRNPKGVALFARAWLDHHGTTGEASSADEARRLLDWLVANASTDFTGMAWGYPYPWQDPGFFAATDFPNRIVSYFVGRALVHGYESLGDTRYLDAAESTCRFLLDAPKVLYEDDSSKCVSYVPHADITMAVMDVSPLCGSLCAIVGKHLGDESLVRDGGRLVAWAVDKQTDYGAWWYTHPPSGSHISHDNYHTGEIIDAIREYGEASGDDRFDDARRRGLEHYRRDLFTSDWRPKWMWDRTFPHDVHGYAVGILTFAAAGEIDVARHIALAAIDDLWDETSGRFYYQKRRWHTIRLTLMRWCQAWMAHALMRLVAIENGA